MTNIKFQEETLYTAICPECGLAINFAHFNKDKATEILPACACFYPT